MRLLELIAYHGSEHTKPRFATSHTGNNSHTFGAYTSTRTGIFFSDNPQFSRMYGTVGKYDLTMQNTCTDLMEWAFRYGMTLDAHDPDQRPMWLEISGITRGSGGDEWHLFEDEVGEVFVPWLKEQGFDSAQFEEWGEDDNGEECQSLTTVVFDPSQIRGLDDNVNESFFSDNMDILMPVVRTLMNTGARPLIYKVWKRSPNAVLALAAIKKLHDQGDPNPMSTLDKLSNLDVPYQFLRRLAWDAGLHDIRGVFDKGKKPSVQNPMVNASIEEDGDLTTVWHVTPTANMPAIKQQGIVPKTGQNSAEWGEPEDAIHVFLNPDSMEDAIANWDMPSWGEEDEVPLTAIKLNIPSSWLNDDPEYPKTIALVKQTIPTSAFVSIQNNI